MFAKILKQYSWVNADSGLLVLRIGVGVIFFMSGWMKAADMSATVGFFASVGFSAFWAYLVTAVELVGGAFVVLGIYARTSALLLAIIMVVASYVVSGNPQAMITPVLMLSATVSLLLSGSGKYSVKEE